MTRRSRTQRSVASAIALALVLSGCSGDDGPDASATTAPPASVTTTTQQVDTGGIEVPELPGTFIAPIPSLGFGIAVPEGWQATVLSEEALDRLADARLDRPSFIEAATQVAATGAVFYAAGVDDEERVSELKVDVQDDADVSAEAVQALAGAVAQSGQVTDGVVVDDVADDGRIRVDYRIALPSADDGEVVDALGSQLFVVDGDRLWSFIITSEDTDTQTALLQIFDASITFDE